MSLRKPHQRHGIVLLIVLSLLVLFVLAGMTFIVVTQQNYVSSKHAAQVETVGDPAEKLMDEVIRQIVRGTNNRHSALWGHDLLGDKYGNDLLQHDGVVAQVVDGLPPANTPGQFLQLQVDVRGNAAWRRDLDYYAGCELTMLDGPARHITVQIVRSVMNPNSPSGREYLDLYVERFEKAGSGTAVRPAIGNRFHINGRPFNGTGAGYDVTARNMSINALYPSYGSLPVNYNPLIGGEDESWDLPDFQNNLLARVPMLPERDTMLDIIPSLHRPALLNYFQAHPVDGLTNNVQLLRQVMQRPNWIDNPNFTGSNPALDFNSLPGNNASKTKILLDRLTRGVASLDDPDDGVYESFAYDVDNDSDGIPESVWVDLGLPPQRQADGRLYKPLVAIKCIDLDGRANLNCLDSHLPIDPNTTVSNPSLISGSTGARPRGSGYGPADLRLSLPSASSPTDPYLVANDTERSNLVWGRYGVNRLPGTDAADTWGFDFLGLRPAGTPNNLPTTYGIATTLNTSFRMPPDLFGQQMTALDHYGQPVRVSNSTTLNHPYEFNLNQPSSADTPYSYAEMEFLLRANDSDAYRLPSRLKELAPITFNSPATNHTTPNGQQQYSNREVVTTASNSLPVPEGAVPPHLRSLPDPVTGLPMVSPSVLQLMRARLASGGSTTIEADLQLLVAPEIRRGEKLNINRLLGNGVDDNNDNVPDVAEGPEGLPNSAQATVPNPAYTLQDNTVSSPQELFARHLFALAMLMSNHDPATATYMSLPSDPSPRAFSRRMAQWCVNVVDFRDADAVMTRFEFDVNPFNGWKDQRSQTNNEIEVVYGCESPEILLTEAGAFHDRRVADTDRDDGPVPAKRIDAMGQEADDDLDQEAIPQGSLFLELYCPRGSNSDTLVVPAGNDALKGSLPAELFAMPPAPRVQKYGVNLGARGVARPNGRRLPVWRIAISESQRPAAVAKTSPLAILEAPAVSAGVDVDRFDPNRRTDVYDRYIWFTSDPLPPVSVEPDRHRIFYNHVDGYVDLTSLDAAKPPATPILYPGRYAVVAPRLVTRFGLKEDRTPSDQELRLDSQQTLVDQPGGRSLRHIGPNWTPGSLGPLVLVASADPPDTWNLATASTRGRQYRIGANVSEPLPLTNPTNRYYPKPTNLAGDQYSGYYGAPYNPIEQTLDRPLDFENTTPLGRDNIYAAGSYPNYRTVYLQRLANPLTAWNPERVLLDANGNPRRNADGSPIVDPDHLPNLPVNPYLTVDFLPVDLTVFNGHEVIPDGWDKDQFGAFDRNPDAVNPGDPASEELGTDLDGTPPGIGVGGHVYENLASRERGPRGTLPASTFPNIFSPHSKLPKVSDSTGTQGHFVSMNFGHSLGYLNRTYGLEVAPAAEYAGTSNRGPFPWFTWNNRPYSNALEMLLVPACSPGRLCLEFNEDDEYTPPAQALLRLTNSTPILPDAITNARAALYRPYRHLWNFFHASTVPNSVTSPDLYRLLDYVEVPSRFAGTQRWYNPSLEFNPANVSNSVPIEHPQRQFLTPFNRLSRKRDPGKINLNTVTRPVFEALFPPSAWLNSGTNWATFVINRRGYAAVPANPDHVGEHFLHPSFPSEFANPYRGANSADLYLPAVVQNEIVTNGLNLAPFTGNEATLLRRHGATGTPGSSDGLLFANQTPSPMPMAASHFDAYFRYEAISRLGNLTTTQSNVYAIWITVGYFELEPSFNTATNPDGYRLGRELGIETGEVQRHRAFFMVDRSLQVAYERGEDNNVEQCITVRRMLEN